MESHKTMVTKQDKQKKNSKAEWQSTHFFMGSLKQIISKAKWNKATTDKILLQENHGFSIA